MEKRQQDVVTDMKTENKRKRGRPKKRKNETEENKKVVKINTDGKVLNKEEAKEQTKMRKVARWYEHRDIGQSVRAFGYSKLLKTTDQKLSLKFCTCFDRYSSCFSRKINREFILCMFRTISYDIEHCDSLCEFTMCMKRWFGEYVNTSSASYMIIVFFKSNNQVCAIFDDLMDQKASDWVNTFSFAMTKYVEDSTRLEKENINNEEL